MSQKICRYNETLQKILGCKTKPEPWLHIVIKSFDKTKPYVGYAVYVWDTRKVVENKHEGWPKEEQVNPRNGFAEQCEAAIKANQTLAKDNRQPLSDKDLNEFFGFGTSAGRSESNSSFAAIAKRLTDWPETVHTIEYAYVNAFDDWHHGIQALGHYAKLTPDMDDKTIKRIIAAVKQGSKGFVHRMATRYHGNPAAGTPGEWKEVFVTDKMDLYDEAVKACRAESGDLMPARL